MELSLPLCAGGSSAAPLAHPSLCDSTAPLSRKERKRQLAKLLSQVASGRCVEGALPFGLPAELTECVILPFCDFRSVEVLKRTFSRVARLFFDSSFANDFYQRLFASMRLGSCSKWKTAVKRRLLITRNPLYRERIMFCMGELSKDHPSSSHAAPQHSTDSGEDSTARKEASDARRRLVKYLFEFSSSYPAAVRNCCHRRACSDGCRVACEDCLVCFDIKEFAEYWRLRYSSS